MCYDIKIYVAKYPSYNNKESELNTLFRLWGKIWCENRLIKDTVICNDNPSYNRTKKIFDAIDQICYEFDLSKPIWLDSTIEDFKKHDKTRFLQDNFIDQIDFDYLEIEVIEED